MSIPVKINVKTTIDRKETFELIVFGQLDQKDQATFLSYEEITEEGPVRTTVKVAGDEALILRNGAVKMRLPFQLHKTLSGTYETPFGRLETTTKARSIKQSGDLIEIRYDFTVQGAHAGIYHLEITFQEDSHEHS